MKLTKLIFIAMKSISLYIRYILRRKRNAGYEDERHRITYNDSFKGYIEDNQLVIFYMKNISRG